MTLLVRNTTVTHRICRTWFRRTFWENLLERTWAQIKIFLSRFQVCLICATKIILCISSIWVFFCVRTMWTTKTSTTGSKLLQIYSKLKEFEVDLKTKDSVCRYSGKIKAKWLSGQKRLMQVFMQGKQAQAFLKVAYPTHENMFQFGSTLYL